MEKPNEGLFMLRKNIILIVIGMILASSICVQGVAWGMRGATAPNGMSSDSFPGQLDSQTPPDAYQCANNSQCKFGASPMCCNGSCVDTSTDVYNCGGCGVKNERCGHEDDYCWPDKVPCNNDCVDPNTFTNSDLNCGGCGKPCIGDLHCENSTCQCMGGSDYKVCDGSRCVNVMNDKNNCGSCGNVCPDGGECSGGQCQCVPKCQSKQCGDDNCGGSCGECPGWMECQDGACVPVVSDNPGTPPEEPQTCKPECSQSQMCCSADSGKSFSCSNVDEDRFNCGRCGNDCSQKNEPYKKNNNKEYTCQPDAGLDDLYRDDPRYGSIFDRNSNYFYGRKSECCPMPVKSWIGGGAKSWSGYDQFEEDFDPPYSFKKEFKDKTFRFPIKDETTGIRYPGSYSFAGRFGVGYSTSNASNPAKMVNANRYYYPIVDKVLGRYAYPKKRATEFVSVLERYVSVAVTTNSGLSIGSWFIVKIDGKLFGKGPWRVDDRKPSGVNEAQIDFLLGPQEEYGLVHSSTGREGKAEVFWFGKDPGSYEAAMQAYQCEKSRENLGDKQWCIWVERVNKNGLPVQGKWDWVDSCDKIPNRVPYPLQYCRYDRTGDPEKKKVVCMPDTTEAWTSDPGE